MSDDTDFIPLRRRLDAMVPLPEEQWFRIVPFLKRRELEPGQFFVRAGDRSTTVGYMDSGTLRYYTSAEGREFIRHFCFGGHFVSANASPDSREPSQYSIQALEKSQLITFSYADWVSLLTVHTVWGQIAQKIHEETLERNERRERSLALEDARTRYRRCLEEFPGIEARVKQYDIASYLGITPVALSRLRGQPAGRENRN
jgi:CRP-like cAMP-binding protein